MTEKIVVVGGVALGTKSACRLKRLDPKADVVLLDKDQKISYGGCGIPYYVSGDVAEASALQSTAFHMVRDEAFFRDVKGFKVITGTEAVKIDRENKKVHTVNRAGEKAEYAYDKLVLGTGSRPKNLKIKGQDLGNIFAIANLQDAVDIKERVASGQIEKAVIVGAGFIGLEMAEAFSDMWDIETSVIEIADRIMPGNVSKSMGQMARKAMETHGVQFYLEEKVEAFEGDGKVARVVTNKRTLEADLVIMAVGIEPNSDLAKDAGLEVGPTGGIVVNERLETSDPDIYSGGDCAEIRNIMNDQPGFYPLGSLANRHGRVIGTNLAGGDATIGGAAGSYVVKLFDASLAGSGLTLDAALKSGYDAISVQMCQMDRAHFYPEKDFMFFELVVEKGTKKVLGIQGLGTSGDAMVGRINTVAATLKYNPVLEDISNLEFAYSPPFSSAMDIINSLANIAENVLEGRLKPLSTEEFQSCWENAGSGDSYFLDCRERPDAEPFLEKYPDTWHNIPQGEIKKRIDEIPKDKEIIVVCNTGMRAYEAQINLREMGLNSRSVEGGMKMLMTWGSDV